MLLTHLVQLEFYAAPDAAKIDGDHAIEIFTLRIRRLREDVLDAGIVVRRVQSAERSGGLRDHRFDSSVIGHVAVDGERFMISSVQCIVGRADGGFIGICQYDGGACFSEGFRCRKARPEPAQLAVARNGAVAEIILTSSGDEGSGGRRIIVRRPDGSQIELEPRSNIILAQHFRAKVGTAAKRRLQDVYFRPNYQRNEVERRRGDRVVLLGPGTATAIRGTIAVGFTAGLNPFGPSCEGHAHHTLSSGLTIT